MAKMKCMRLVTKVVVYFPEIIIIIIALTLKSADDNGDPTSIGEMWERVSRVTISPQAVHEPEDDDHDDEDDDHDYEDDDNDYEYNCQMSNVII